MALFLAPLMTFWLFRRESVWFTLALTIALVFDIQPISIAGFHLNLHFYFFMICLFYAVKYNFAINFTVNKDFAYTFALISLPLLIFAFNGGSLGFLIYLSYFCTLGCFCNFIIQRRYNICDFLKQFSLVSTSVILCFTFFEIYGFRTSYFAYSSVYDLSGVREIGGFYGRALGPSREPSHLILLQITILILASNLHKNWLIFVIFFSWFLISQFTFSRSIFIVTVVLGLYCAFINSRGLYKFVVPVLTLLCFGFLLSFFGAPERFTSGFRFDTDISTLQRYGTLYIILKEYVSTYTYPVILLFADISVCIDRVSALDRLVCEAYVPALGFTAYYISSLPIFIFLFLVFNRHVVYLVVPVLVAGLTYWVTITPALLSLLLLWLLRKERAK